MPPSLLPLLLQRVLALGRVEYLLQYAMLRVQWAKRMWVDFLPCVYSCNAIKSCPECDCDEAEHLRFNGALHATNSNFDRSLA